MNNIKTALESAIAFTTIACLDDNYHEATCNADEIYELKRNALEQCKSALAELEGVEPVGYVITGKLGERCSFRAIDVNKGDMVFTSPQTREWVGLTDVEISKAFSETYREVNSKFAFAKAIGAKLRELNTKG